ncbi:hypothetical protein L6164_034013 [Bauhinia variegata]|uniref:Uncharacterized protein n=1 Tax=Bauhinia variegata TaxID=167791 RepID=A0ACB9KTL6_BAUVA|nr:hypothetical protein L6164_034013 [Bauhinia variegata]
MREKNTTSPLKRILMNCSSQAKNYGSCVAAKVPEIEHDVCAKEFLALKNCMQNMLKKKLGGCAEKHVYKKFSSVNLRESLLS